MIAVYYTCVFVLHAFFLIYFIFFFFFFNDTATTDIYTLSLHDALPISWHAARRAAHAGDGNKAAPVPCPEDTEECTSGLMRSEEHTSELQSHSDLVCRLLLEKKKKKKKKKYK